MQHRFIQPINKLFIWQKNATPFPWPIKDFDLLFGLMSRQDVEAGEHFSNWNLWNIPIVFSIFTVLIFFLSNAIPDISISS